MRPPLRESVVGIFRTAGDEGRAGIAVVAEGETPSGQLAGCRRYWVAAERARSFRALFRLAVFEQRLAEVEDGGRP